MTPGDLLALAGIVATAIFGLVAIIVAVRADHRARTSGDAALRTLTTIDAIVARLPTTVDSIVGAVEEVDLEVSELRTTVMLFYRDVLHLVASSQKEFIRIFGAQAPSKGGDAGADAGFAGAARTSLETLRLAEAPGVSVEHRADEGDSTESLRDAVLRAVAATGPVDAATLVRRLGAEKSLYPVLEALYRLRIAREVEWADAILQPESIISIAG
jgi:hypothetical protein